MKKNNRGFMLVEILLVVTVIVTSMIFLYVQITNMDDTYDSVFHYNTVTGIYAMENIKNFLIDDGVEKIKDGLKENAFVDLSTCSSDYIYNPSYCTILLESTNVNKLYFTKQNIKELYEIDFETDMEKFIKNISYDQTNAYRIIVKYNDGTFSSMKMEV